MEHFPHIRSVLLALLKQHNVFPKNLAFLGSAKFSETPKQRNPKTEEEKFYQQARRASEDSTDLSAPYHVRDLPYQV